MIKKISFILFFIILIFPAGKVFGYPSVCPGGVTIDEPSKTYDGYTTFANIDLETKSDTIYMIDMEGNVVHEWEDIGHTLNNRVLPNGHVYLAMLQPEMGAMESSKVQGWLQAIVGRDWNNNVIWTYENDHLHHIFDVLPNENVLALFWGELPKELRSQVKGGIPGTEAEDGKIYADYVRLIDHNTKETLWEWKTWEGLNISNYPLNPIDNRNQWPGINFAKYLPEGNPFNGRESVMISLRRCDTVIIVDMETKKVVWEWGKGEISHQHDPQLLDNGNILLLDNGYLRPSSHYAEEKTFSRIVEVNPSINKIVWEYDGSVPGSMGGLPFFTPFGGFIQRLPTGNTLIAETNMGRIFEVTPEKEIVWEHYTGKDTDTMFRFTSEESNFPEKLPPARPTGKPLGGRKIVGGREIIEKLALPYQVISILGWVIAISSLILVIKIKRSKIKE